MEYFQCPLPQLGQAHLVKVSNRHLHSVQEPRNAARTSGTWEAPQVPNSSILKITLRLTSSHLHFHIADLFSQDLGKLSHFNLNEFNLGIGENGTAQVAGHRL